jgi:hypothetical protein
MHERDVSGPYSDYDAIRLTPERVTPGTDALSAVAHPASIRTGSERRARGATSGQKRFLARCLLPLLQGLVWGAVRGVIRSDAGIGPQKAHLLAVVDSFLGG